MVAASLIQDLRQAFRAVRGMPLVAVVIVGSLAVGIGVNTVVFSWMQALMLRPLPGVAEASQIHLIEPRTETGRPGASWLEFEDLERAVGGTVGLAAFRMTALTIGEAARSERVTALLVSPRYFETLQLVPAAGRFFTETETRRGANPDVAVVSFEFWRDRLASAEPELATILISGRELRVIGVTPERFQGTVLGLQFDVWVPAVTAPLLLAGSTELDSRSQRGYYLMARVPGDAALTGLRDIVQREMRFLATQFPESNRDVSAEVLSFWRASRGPQGLFLQAVGVLQGVLLLLLLAVCGNTANLLLARASDRQREVGVRLAVGGSPSGVIRMLLLETLLMSVAAAALGGLLASWATRLLQGVVIVTTAFPVRLDTSLDATTLGFVAVLALISTFLAGLIPALQLARLDPLAALREEGVLFGRGRVRQTLIGAEVAVALIVLLVAGVLYRQFAAGDERDLGFGAGGVLLAAYDLGGRGLTPDEARSFAARLRDRLTASPGVDAVAVASAVPLDIHGLPQRSFTIEGRSRVDAGRDRALSNVVTPGYFAVMQTPLVEGADFVSLDDRAAAPEIIVNQAFRARFIGEGTVLGRVVESGERRYRIVGVVRDSTYDALGEAAAPAMFFSYRDRPLLQGEVHLRTREGAEAGLASTVREAARALDAGLPIYNVRTLADHVERNLVLRRIPSRLFIVLGPLLLALAASGIYAMVAYAVARRTREVGIRLALGGTSRRITRQIVVESSRAIVAGAIVGWTAVWMVYIHVAPGAAVSPIVFGGTPAVLLLVAIAACWIPARRVARVEPALALRLDQ